MSNRHKNFRRCEECRRWKPPDSIREIPNHDEQRMALLCVQCCHAIFGQRDQQAYEDLHRRD